MTMRSSSTSASLHASTAAMEAEAQPADLAQLQREYRNMEMNRRVYADESHQVMRRQQAVIEKLRKDNDDMKHELLLATRHFTESSVAAQQEQLARLHDQLEGFHRKNAAESKKLETLTHQIQVLRHKVLHQKKHMGGVNAAKENLQMVGKQIRILENRLDKSLVKFNEALAQNKVLREEIDNLRRERVVFDTIYRKLEREHNDKKKQMAATIELSNLAYEQRDAANLELRGLQEQTRVEGESHRRALGELLDKVEEARARGAAIGDDAMALYKRGMSPGGRVGDLSLEEELEMKKKIQKGTWGVAKEKVHVQVSIERVQNFEEAFQKIKAATRIDDLEELVAAFIKKEDQNFSLFNYVNEQTNEIEKLEEWLGALRDEERKYGDDGGDDIGQHKQLLRELEARLQATEQAADKCEAKCQDAQKTITAVKSAIQSLFVKVGGDAQQMAEMLGDAVVTEANLMAYLGVIEDRTNDVLQQFAALAVHQQKQQKLARAKGHSDAFHEEQQFVAAATGSANNAADSSVVQSVLGIGPITPMGADPLQINPPNLEDYSSEDDDSGDGDDAMHPLTRDELKVRTLKGLRRLNHATGPSASKDVRRANNLAAASNQMGGGTGGAGNSNSAGQRRAG